jgi:hypothetical protein
LKISEGARVFVKQEVEKYLIGEYIPLNRSLLTLKFHCCHPIICRMNPSQDRSQNVFISDSTASTVTAIERR